MKIPPRQVSSFINAPDKTKRVILLYGPNTGMVSEYAQKLAQKFVDDINDPFNVIRFTASSIAEDPVRFRDETVSMSLMGGQRLLWVRETAETITPHIKTICDSEDTIDNIILIEGGDLSTKSALRKLCEGEKNKNAVTIACYLEEERDIGGKLREICQHAGYSIDADGLRLLTESLAGDSALLRSEVEKLILYKGLDPEYQGFAGEPLRRKIGEITLDDILACNPNMRDYSLDDLISMTATGQVQRANAMAQKMLAEGLPPIAIMRALLRHFRRLHATICRLGEGEQIDSALKALKPPVFFKYKQDFSNQARKWTKPHVEALMQKIVLDESTSKTSGVNAETLCLHLIMNIARTAQALR